MFASSYITSWFLVMFPLVYSPGPANTLFASNGAAFGFRKSLSFMLGIDLAFIVQSLLAGFGLSELLLHYPLLFTVIRYAGIAYIIYLGYGFLKAAGSDIKEQPHCLSFKDGLIVTALNPKAWVMQMMMFSQFLEQGESWVASVLQLTVLLAVLNISGHIVWILFGSLLVSQATSVFSPRIQNSMYAVMLFGSIYFLV